jgi:hypothetical protein
MRAAASLVIVSTLAVLAVSSAARADTLSFRIYKEDDLIGHDTYSIVRDGDNVTVKVAMQTDTKLFFIPFHYRQDRTEIWKGGQLQSLLSDTDDDGEKHHVEVHRDADSLVGTADGENKSLLGDSAPFTLWSNELVKHSTLINVSNFERIKVEVVDKGTEQIALGGNKLLAHHFLLTGDLHWDLWYGPDNMLLKTAFKRSGFPITFVRE